MDRHRDPYVLRTDRVDVDLVHRWLSEQSYWGAGRSMETVRTSIERSSPYSVFLGEEQVAFARLITDGTTFAWLCDVFVAQEHRGRGLGHWLVESVLADHEEQVPRFLLATRDAHEVYASAGFTPLPDPELYMVRRTRPVRPA